ncbi:MAG: DUF3576 domain-containing protein [Bdellovibrionales bacterium]|jgi:hypothetical protein
MSYRPFSFCSPSLFKKAAFLGLFLVFLVGCSETGLQTDATYKDKTQEEMYRYGSLASDKGGIDILGSADKKKDQTGLGVNGFLWRATLDTLSFMPIASADPFGGVITTDWYAAPDAPNERAKINVFILDRDLRADGVKVSVFRQTKGVDGQWADAAVVPSTASSLEETILTRARQMRLAQKEMK